MDGKVRAIVMASVAGLIAAAGMSAAGEEEQAGAEKVPCYGINKCKATGDCGGKGHSCAGQNQCGGQGYLSLERETCLKIQNGRLTEAPEPQS